MPKTLWDHLPAKQYLAAQEQHLVRFIREMIYPYSPYYRELLDYNRIKPGVIKTVKDLSCIPFTTKADIAPLPEDPDIPFSLVLQPTPERMKETGLSLRMKQRGMKLTRGRKGYAAAMDREFLPIHYHFTIGRTALPTPVLYTQYDLLRMGECGRRLFELLELKREDLVINAFPFAPHLAFWMTYFAAEAAGVPALHTGGGRILGTHRILDALERLKGTALTATPSYAYHLLRLAASEGRDFSSLHTLIMGGDRLPAGLKGKIQELLGKVGAEKAAVASTYGFTEGRVAWSECRPSALSKEESSGYHLFPDMEIIEIIDPDSGSRLSEGEDGELVYTSLEWRGSVLLRFRTGDLIKGGLDYSPCPFCGRSLPRLGLEITRTSEYKEFELTKLKGTLVDLNAFYPLLSGHKDVLEWQLEIRKHNDDPYDLDELYLHVAPAEGMSKRYLEKELQELLQREIEVAPTRIVFHSLPRLLHKLGLDTKGRERRFVDLRPGAAGRSMSEEEEPEPQESMDFEGIPEEEPHAEGCADDDLLDED
ncbi:MAG: phenylacetate--CoA ligase family protein [Actinobacteria bacterium]|jgi:phenylacetate-coenzyme A ligase PaaK-like adenylate-forming protein|nr:MAG: phenylacetate--CoA ligase family protein [Actinomycetota bacterium]